jgi:predicted outer membrane repeat protein
MRTHGMGEYYPPEEGSCFENNSCGRTGGGLACPRSTQRTAFPAAPTSAPTPEFKHEISSTKF